MIKMLRKIYHKLDNRFVYITQMKLESVNTYFAKDTALSKRRIDFMLSKCTSRADALSKYRY
jgi:hypothetical protein